MTTLPLSDATLGFWGKARPPQGTDLTFHPLVAHALDVATVAQLLDTPAPAGLPPATLGLLVALHDVGKFSDVFQAKVPHAWPAALGPLRPLPPDPGHDTTGYALLADGELHRLIAPLFPSWNHADIAPLLRAVTGHHGRPPREMDRPLGRNQVSLPARAAAAEFVRAMLALFAPEPLPASLRGDRALAWRLAGLTTLADWIGSAARHFPYAAPEALRDPRAYRDTIALPAARRALAASGLSPAGIAAFTGMGGLFPDIATPSPLQAWAEAAALPQGPVLAILEDVTGAGKTEAALVLAQRMMTERGARGVFLGLPTMATANAMYRRMAGSYRRLFAEGPAPSLVLAHGRAKLDDGFSDSILADVAEDLPPADHDPASESAGAQCAAWLADDRRKALLAQFGVGTIDQALLAVLPVRHAPLRQRGLAGKVLIVDEAHAFDPYMREEVARLLHFHAALGGSAILLSATLPLRLRQGLADAWRAGLGAAPAAVSATAYPLGTLVGGDAVREEPVAARTHSIRHVPVSRIGDVAEAVARIGAAHAQGAAVAWVRNTVDDAIAACAALRDAGIDATLFHARFAMADRLRIEAGMLERFGRDSGKAQRNGVIVATQVIEQSLDLDFDLMVSDLAPVDLLIQRAGRLWRHERGAARPLSVRELLVLSPEPVAEPPADWLRAHRGTEAVYRDPALLWRGAVALFAAGGIATPEGLRDLIEAAAAGAEPDGLLAASARASGESLTRGAVAKQNLLDFAKGYADSAGRWAAEERTPTRWEDRPQVTLRLAVLRGGKVVPYATDPELRRAWAMSEVSVAASRIGEVPVPPGLEAAAAEARQGWKRWEREAPQLKLAILEPDGDGGFRPVAGGGYRYDRAIGLFWGGPAEAG